MEDDDKFEIGVGPAKIAGSGKAVSRLGDAIADLVSPFSQGFGLIGDHIRIYRERSIASVLEKAKKIAEERHEKISAVNPKNLVPLLENASMDDPEGGLAELWARLLLSGDENFDAEMAQFSDSLRRIGRKEAEFLKAACAESETFPLELATDSLLRHNLSLVENMSKKISFTAGEAQLRLDIEEFNSRVGLHYGKIYEGWIWNDVSKSSITYYADGKKQAEILEREGLMRVVHFEEDSSSEDKILTFCDVTAAGVSLIRRCYPELVAEAEARRKSRK